MFLLVVWGTPLNLQFPEDTASDNEAQVYRFIN